MTPEGPGFRKAWCPWGGTPTSSSETLWPQGSSLRSPWSWAPVPGGAVYSPAITDFIFMVRGTSYMFVTGPDVVKTVTHEDVDMESLGGADIHASKSGVAHFAHDSEPEALAAVRELMRFLPQNNTEPPPFLETDDPPDRRDEKLLEIVPDNPNHPYDMHEVIRCIVDDGEFLEVHAGFAGNILTGFARLGGHSGGNHRQPTFRSGRGSGHRLLRQGGSVRPVLRRLQHPSR